MTTEENLTKAQHSFFQGYREQINGNVSAAEICYSESIDHFPTAEAYTLLGCIFSLRQDYEQALAYCQIAIQLDPKFGNAWNDAGAVTALSMSSG